ncbi:Na+/H+ antiporter NhaA [Rhodovulum adriaticum]|uniref:Putative Na(+)/H(+) antiporter NhaA homolog n=1 Tax=Rhodovulum adriaticum TaxID=35804 RepID=A0A4R2NK78_RHOAD|nr:Na+/H+ antiporter NhaA [Rhodovulum adriaticum]MBK1634737.1 sodium:proton antiporter [Rhodovulum adriaticum]TCP21554.1 sodium/proton antiporter (NhaA family) [Rhodovulum adriaticum]
MYRVWNALGHNAALLLAGIGMGLAWAALAPGTYNNAVEFVLLEGVGIGHPHEVAGEVRRVLTVEFLVNGMLMSVIFAVAFKELWEALILKRGALRGRKAAAPLLATAGGMIGPVAVYLGLVAFLGPDAWAALARGWTVPMATDIALAFVVGRAVFGTGHPAVRVLLLLAITDDLVAMALLTVLHPAGTVQPAWLLVPLAAGAGAFGLFNWLPRHLDRGHPAQPNTAWVRRRLSLWPYAVAGAISWYGVQQSGLNPALGLLPVVPALPHADRAFGLFSEAERYLNDLLNHAEHLLRRPVGAILFLFGLCNAGVDLGAAGPVSLFVLAALLLGKPLGVVLFGGPVARALRLPVPPGMRPRELAVIGLVAGIGLTVPLLAAGSAFDAGPVLDGIDAADGARIGLLLSLGAAPLALLAARLMGVRRRPG